MRYNFFFVVLIVVCYCLFGCGDESVDATDVLGVFSTPEDIVTDLPPKVWETLQYVREYRLREYQKIGRDTVGADVFDAEVELVAEVKAMQEAFYTKYINAGGIAIIGNDDTADKHLVEAQRAVLVMTSKFPELRDRLSLEHREFYLILKGPATPWRYVPEILRDYKHIDGDYELIAAGGCNQGYCFSGVNEVHRRLEEDEPCGDRVCRCFLGYCYVVVDDPRYRQVYLETFVHEFAHALHGEMSRLDLSFNDRLKSAYAQAHELKTWSGLYADTNYSEYWAEGTEFWFYGTTLSDDFEITREELKERDPLLYQLLSKWYPDVSLPRTY